MIGDLPEADSKPPTNMLFVCKLNGVRLPWHPDRHPRLCEPQQLLAHHPAMHLKLSTDHSDTSQPCWCS